MDFTVIRNKLGGWWKKYRYVVIVLAAGILLMLIPTGSKRIDDPVYTEPLQEQGQVESIAEELEGILSKINGAGKVKVLLTYAAGERTIFQTNERNTSTQDSQSKDTETVLITDGNRKEEALVAQVLAPEYLGAVIVCQGAEDPSVRLAISEAVSKATGLGADRISVLKMK